jgi:hypothetical protein
VLSLNGSYYGLANVLRPSGYMIKMSKENTDDDKRNIGAREVIQECSHQVR